MSGTVVMLSSVHWHFTWQRHQNFAAGLAERGYKVTFVEPLPKRWPRLSEFRRVLGRLAGTSASGMCTQRVPPGVSLVSPRLLPDVGPLAQWANRALLLRPIEAAIRSRGLEAPVVVINYLPTRASHALQRSLPSDLIVYDCCWDWSSDPYSTGLESIEADLVRDADLVLSDSPHNTERMRALHGDVQRVEHGVDYELFAAASRDVEPQRGEQITCAYFGDLGTNIDVELLRRVSQQHALSLIGPVRIPLEGFGPKTQVLGPVPQERLPALLRDAQVLLLPYRNAPDTRGVAPVKTVECLATGKPTVAIALPSLGSMGEWMYLASDQQEFLDLIPAAASEELVRRDARQNYARANTWSHRVDRVAELLRERLGAKAQTPTSSDRTGAV